MNPPIDLSSCWAKTDPITGKPALTVRDHSLIATMVGAMILDNLPPACRMLAPKGTNALIGLHDIGKITPGFLRKATGSRFASVPGWQECCGDHSLVGQEFIASLRDDGKPMTFALAIGGHHGRYPTTRVRNNLGKPGGPHEGGLTWPNVLRHELLDEILRISGTLPACDLAIGPRLHWLTGLIVFCDWIASNTDWFPLNTTAETTDTWTVESASNAASKAIELIGWHRRAVRTGLSFEESFGSHTFQPNPLQQCVLGLVNKPGLYIIEAPMGVGKTEATLAAAYKRWTDGGERGLYFALPTQLTSNRIHLRISRFLQNIIADAHTVQTLVHGNAWLSEDRARAFSPSHTPGESSDAQEACRWFASARKSLLAPFGTGTIDQALMAVLSAKHSALRLFALSGKVVVIDEVHSYDPYTSALVDRLVTWLLEVKCTVIILSATLTAARRKALVTAAGAAEPPLPAPVPYPMITKVVSNQATHHAVPGPPAKETHVRIKAIPAHRDEEMLRHAATAASAGACVLIIRNTVALAQDTFLRMREALHGDHIEVGLVHSRFPHSRRMANEGRWTRLLGNQPDSSRPQGCILVATQVVEQSVDIDADLLFTDLAPTDLILQRLGRLHRHPRTRPAGYENAQAVLLIPDANWEEEDLKIVKSAIGPSAWVYPPISLYQAERLWKDIGAVSLPSDIRNLLETPLPPNLPPAAAAFAKELDRGTADMISQAAHQDVFRSPSEDDKEGVQTRYNIKANALLVILDALPDRQPPVFDYDLARHLHEHAARISRYRVSGALANQLPWFAAQIDNAILAVRRPGTSLLDVHGQENLTCQIHYRDDLGITFETITPAYTSFPSEPEDGWY